MIDEKNKQSIPHSYCNSYNIRKLIGKHHMKLNKWKSIPTYRLLIWLVFLLALAGVIASLLAQYVLGMNPCVMCIQQRLSLIGITIIAAICLLLPLSKSWGRTVAALLVTIPSGFGLYIAIKQIYLQNLPLLQQPSCGAPLSFRLRAMNAPLLDWYEPLIRGTGACGEIYKILGLSLPVWSTIFFSLILLLVWGGWLKALKNS